MGQLHERVAAELLARTSLKAKRDRGAVRFLCPRHDDHNPSAWVKEGTWGCMSCGFREPLQTLADLLGLEPPSRDYRLGDYAAEKGFSLEVLRFLGLADRETPNGTVVAIPYYDQSGALLRTKLRAAGKRMWWGPDGRGTHLYGLERLRDWPAEKPVILVEGESDSHAAWHHGVLAVGVPGANTWHGEWADFFKGRAGVYVWQEPGDAGAAFVRSVARDLPGARVIRDAGVKDLADLHRKVGGRFKEELNRLAVQAVPITAPPPPVPFDAMLGEHLMELMKKKLQPIDAVPTCLPTWNQVCRDDGGGVGLARGWHIILAAASGKGKSVGACNLAAAAAVRGERVTYITLEMSQGQLETRLLSVASGVPIRMLEQGKDFNEAAFREACRRMAEIHETTGGLVSVNRRIIRQLPDILDAIRYNYEVHGSRYFILDYLQLAWVGRADDLYTRIVEVSGAVANLAHDLPAVHVGLSQFNRDTTKGNPRPAKEGLMGGSSLENDADQVVLLWRPPLEEGEREDEGRERRMVALIDKNRHGMEVEVEMFFDRANLRIRERYPHEEPSWAVK